MITLTTVDGHIKVAAIRAVGKKPVCNCKSFGGTAHMTTCALMVWSSKVYEIQACTNKLIAKEFVARAVKENPFKTLDQVPRETLEAIVGAVEDEGKPDG